jgi:hypothetical protein
MKRFLALVVLFVGVTLAQGIESQKQYERNETIKLSTFGMSMRFDFVVFGDISEYLIEQGSLKVAPQPGLNINQVKASIQAAVQGQYQSLKLEGGLKISGSTLIGRYRIPENNTYWRIVYRQGPPGQGVLVSSESIIPKAEARAGQQLLALANGSIKFFAPQTGQLGVAWKSHLKQDSIFVRDGDKGPEIMRFCNPGEVSIQTAKEFPRLNLIQGWTPNDPAKRVSVKWKVYPISDKRAFLILEYAPNDVRTVDLRYNDGADGSTPAVSFAGTPFYIRTPAGLTERKVDFPECQ